MTYHSDNCAWKRCRQDSVVTYAGLGLCQRHEHDFHRRQSEVWHMADRDGYRCPTMRETLVGRVRHEALEHMTPEPRREEVTA